MTPEEKKALEAKQAEEKRFSTMEDTLKGISDGTTATLETVKTLDEKVMSMEEAIAASDAKALESEKAREEMADSFAKQGETVTGLRKLLTHKHGESGADDYLNTFGKWIKGVYHQKRYGSVPEEYAIAGYDFEYQALGNAKSATTQSDGNAGFLIPDILFPELQMTEDIYGNLLPQIRQIPVAPGSMVKINEQATKANASWRCAECTAIPESEILLSQKSLEPCLLGDITPVSQELFRYPGVKFAEIIADNVARSIVEKKEMGILQADHTVGGAAAPPSDGVLVDATVNDITAGLPVGATLADYLTFIAAGVENYPALMRTGMLFLPLMRHFALMSELVNKSCSSPAWAAMEPGSPSSPLGFPVLPHLGMTISTAEWAAFLNPKDIMGASSGGMAVDINPYASPGWSSNCISIKLYTYFDWVLLNAAGMSKGDYATS